MGKTMYFKTDIRRLVKNYPMYLAILGVAGSLLFSLENSAFEPGMVNENAMDTCIMAMESSGVMIAYAFCAFAFAPVFCEDLEQRYLRYSIGRGNRKKYVVSKAGVIYLASAAAMILGMGLFGLYVRFRLPWTVDGVCYLAEGGLYGSLLEKGWYAAYLFLCALQMGMLAGTLSLLAAFVSLFVTNKMIILITPVLAYQVLLEFRGSGWANVMIFNPRAQPFSGDAAYFLTVCCFSLLPGAVLTWEIYRQIKHRL